MSDRVATPDVPPVCTRDERVPRLETDAAPGAPAATASARAGLGLIRTFEAYARILRLYPPEHRRVTSTLEAIRGVLSQYFAGEGALEITLTAQGLLCNGDRLDAGSTIVQWFAGDLKKLRIRTLRFRPGIGVEEIRKLGEILTSDHRRLLLRGGVEIAFPEEERPHLEIDVFAIRDLLTGDMGLEGILPDGVEHLRDSLGSDAIRQRVRDLQVLLRECMPDGSDDAEVDLIGVIVERLVHVDAWAVDAEKACSIVSRFLEILESHLKGRKDGGSALATTDVPEILAAALTQADPDDLLQLKSKLRSLVSLFQPRKDPPAAAASADGADASILTRNGDLRCMAEIPADILERFERVAFDPRTLIQDLGAHDLHVEALGIASELLVAVQTETVYRESREGLIRLFRQASPHVESFVRAALYLARELPPPPMEERAALLAEILRQDVQRTAIVRFLEVQEDRPEDLLRILQIFLEESPPLLLEAATRLLPHPLLGSLRAPIEGLLLRALAHPGAVGAWLGAEPEGALEAETFDLIASRVPSVAHAIVKRIFTTGTADIQEKLLRRLHQGDGAARLEWVIHGLGAPDRGLRLRIIGALGEFRQPRAVEALRAILRRQNASQVIDGEEVSIALRALAQMGTSEAAAEIRAVRSGRRFLRPIYRKEIRRALAEILEKETAP